MSTKDIIGLLIVCSVSIGLLVVAFLFLMGKGASLIAGYNTASDKEKYNEVKLCKFVGKLLVPIAVFLPVIAIGGIYQIAWLPIVYVGLVVGIVIFSVIYANTANRFKE